MLRLNWVKNKLPEEYWAQVNKDISFMNYLNIYFRELSLK